MTLIASSHASDPFLPSMMVKVHSDILLNADTVIKALGGCPDQLCGRIGFPLEVIQGKPRYILAAETIQLLNFCAKELRADDFGLRLANISAPKILGPVWPLVQHAANVDQIVGDIRRYLPLHSLGMYATTQRYPGGLQLNYGILGSERTRDKQVIENAFGMFCRSLQLLLGETTFKPNLVKFRHGGSQDLTLYHALFGRQIEFNQDTNSICFEDKILVKPVVSADPSIRASLLPTFETALQKIEISLIRSIEIGIRETLPSGGCDLQKVAQRMHLSDRTLQRLLAPFGVTFANILARVKKDLALSYLRQSDLSLIEIAEILDFQSLSAFSRSFKKLHGKTLREMHKRK